MSKPVRIRNDVVAQVQAVADGERRSLANMVEVLLLAALTERGGLPGGRGLSGDGAAGNGDESRLPAAAAPRSVSPADVAATVPGVDVLRPHMRGDRPAVQCTVRVAPGLRCGECGAVT